MYDRIQRLSCYTLNECHVSWQLIVREFLGFVENYFKKDIYLTTVIFFLKFFKKYSCLFSMEK